MYFFQMLVQYKDIVNFIKFNILLNIGITLCEQVKLLTATQQIRR